MKSDATERRRGVTRIEIVVVVALILLVWGMLQPVSRVRGKRERIACVSNLKQIGLAQRMTALDRGTNLLINLTANPDEARESAQGITRLWRQSLALTNEWATPNILWCPADTQRRRATTFISNPAVRRAVVFTSDKNLSYFLGLNSSESNPNTIGAGDRNLTTNGSALGPGRHVIAAGSKVGFTEQIHISAGNVLLGDGSVQQGSNGRMNEMFQEALDMSGLTTCTWLVP